jgi:hypothetical protein
VHECGRRSESSAASVRKQNAELRGPGKPGREGQENGQEWARPEGQEGGPADSERAWRFREGQESEQRVVLKMQESRAEKATCQVPKESWPGEGERERGRGGERERGREGARERESGREGERERGREGERERGREGERERGRVGEGGKDAEKQQKEQHVCDRRIMSGMEREGEE